MLSYPGRFFFHSLLVALEALEIGVLAAFRHITVVVLVADALAPTSETRNKTEIRVSVAPSTEASNPGYLISAEQAAGSRLLLKRAKCIAFCLLVLLRFNTCRVAKLLAACYTRKGRARRPASAIPPCCLLPGSATCIAVSRLPTGSPSVPTPAPGSQPGPPGVCYCSAYTYVYTNLLVRNTNSINYIL